MCSSQVVWRQEGLYPNWAQTFRVKEVLARERSAFQDIEIVDTVSHGRVLLLDGIVQVTEADEFVYQEMITHVPLIQHGAAQRVLIIGAGDGGVLRRVLQHTGIKQVVMVEIDEAVIRLARAYLPSIGGQAWLEPRASIVIDDGIDYLRKAQSAHFDVIIIDSTDPTGPGEGLFTESFYHDCSRTLKQDGILVSQCGVPFMQADGLAKSYALQATIFRHASAYVAAVPTYVGGFMAIGIAGNNLSVPVPVNVASDRACQSGVRDKVRYWSPSIHTACFALPGYLGSNVPEIWSLFSFD